MAVGGGQGDGGEAGGIAAATAIAFSSPVTVLPAASKVASAVSGGTGPVNLSTSKVARAQSMMLFDGTKQAKAARASGLKPRTRLNSSRSVWDQPSLNFGNFMTKMRSSGCRAALSIPCAPAAFWTDGKQHREHDVVWF